MINIKSKNVQIFQQGRFQSCWISPEKQSDKGIKFSIKILDYYDLYVFILFYEHPY